MYAISLGITATSMAAEPQYGGTFRTHNTPTRSLDPHMETYTATVAVTNNVYNHLLRFKEDMSGVVPDLAESWQRTDDRTYVFKLHKGVRWQDVPPVNGRELTSADVKYSIERISGMYGKKPDYKHRYYFEDKLAAIETPDKYTVVIKTKEPYAPFIRYIASPWSAIVPREAVEEFGDLKRKAIGSGPFILTEFVRGSHILLKKNPNYFKKGLPYLDEVHIKILRDPAPILSGFLAKKFDRIQFYFFQIPTVKKEDPEAVIVQQKAQFMWVLRCPPWIEGKKPLKPPFDNVKVRRAIGHAIDKKRLLKLAWGGFGTVQVGPVPNWPPYSLTEADQVEYNPEKARKLLAEAGYPNGFSAELMTWNLAYMTKPAQIIKEMLKEVGVHIDLKLLEMAQYFNRAYRFDYEMALHIMTAAIDPEEWLVPYYGKLEESTFYKWSNKEIWRMCEEQSHILDEGKRVAKIQEIQRKVLEDTPNVFLYTQTAFRAYRPYVHPKVIHKNSFQFLNAERIWMEKH